MLVRWTSLEASIADEQFVRTCAAMLRPPVDINNYAFIDGNYLRRAYLDTMRKLFPEVHYSDLDLEKVKHAAGASRVFYYDAIDEQADDASERTAYLDKLNELDGFHVRKGLITGSTNKKRQKGVDVQLAVECLTHAHNKTIWHATLFAGDLDFQPLVAQLVNIGVHVHVYYERRSGARKLYQSADVAVPIRIADFWDWSTHDFQNANALIKTDFNVKTPPFFVIERALWGSLEVTLLRNTTHGVYPGHAIHVTRNGATAFRYGDPSAERLKTFFELQHGHVEWKAPA